MPLHLAEQVDVAIRTKKNYYYEYSNRYSGWGSGTPALVPGVDLTQAGRSNAGATFVWPGDLAVDQNGNVYVLDTGNDQVKMITQQGPANAPTTFVYLVKNLGYQTGVEENPTTNPSNSLGLTVDVWGNLFVAENRDFPLGGGGVYMISPVNQARGFSGNINANFVVSTTSSLLSQDHRFACASGVAVDGYGYVYVSDMFSNNIWQIVPGPSNGIGSGPNTGAPFTTSSTGMRTVAWANPSGTAGSDNGPSATATFNFPSGIAADAYGDLFVVEGTTRHDFDVEVAAKFSTLQSLFNQSAIGFDFGTNTVRLIRAGDVTPDGITSGGQVSILAGRAGISGSSDGTGEGASVQLSAPQGAAVDQAGNVYVADNGNRSVRKITPAGVATILADGFQNVLDVAVDAQQNVYVADSGYDVQFGSIFRVTPDGTKTLLFSGQDIFAGEKSWIMNPLGLTVDPAGNIFFTTPLGGIFELAAPLTSGMTPIPVLADYRSTTPTIRPAGGAGMGATFVGIAAASTTQLYVADVYDNNVQSVSLGETGWSATVLAGGDATNPGFADSISGSAFFNHPTRLAWDQDGNSLYVYDAGNNAIRQINVGGLNPVTTVVNGSGRMGNLAGDVAATAGLASPLMPAFTTSIAGFSTMNFLGGLNAQMPTTVYATGPYYWGLAVDPTSLVGARRLIITVPDAVLKAQF